jgi:hypothetical protein
MLFESEYMLRSVYHLMTCEQMMKEKRRDIVNDSMQALHALAKLMPLLNSQCSLSEMLGTINRVLGSTLAWVSVDDDDGLQRWCAQVTSPVTLLK